MAGDQHLGSSWDDYHAPGNGLKSKNVKIACLLFLTAYRYLYIFHLCLHFSKKSSFTSLVMI